ncbi:hypothetical protein V6N12_075064 [Hibiscus sabdariffa]|uniref:Co-chaperone protein p23 n=1 Tax=Hibiscus sabdariffa TaxID=183260 RepID=A0ABR2BZH7_9ROSI
MSRHPEVKWAQRADKVFISVQLSDSKDAKDNLEPEGVFSFTGTTGTGNTHYCMGMACPRHHCQSEVGQMGG